MIHNTDKQLKRVAKELDNYSWLNTQLPKLIKNATDLINICPEERKVHGWTALKLIALLYYVGVYTSIIPKYFDKMYYLDLFSGCGINRVRKRNDILMGSPIIAGWFARKPFDKMFLIESKRNLRSCLRTRLNFLKSQLNIQEFEVIEAETVDCNQNIDDIIPVLDKNHYLAFIDPEGMQVNWATMLKLLRLNGDLIIRFPIAEIRRVWRAAAKEKWEDRSANNIKALIRFFGKSITNDVIRKLRDIDLLTKYMDQLRQNGREIVKNITIKGDNDYHYDLIYAVRATPGGSPWMEAVDNLKRRIERFSGKAVERALDVWAGRAWDLPWFFSKESPSTKSLDNYP